MTADSYSFLGPAGTFTEQALAQAPAAQGKPWLAANNVFEAINNVVSGRSIAAMVAIENSVDGSVSATHDALANTEGLRILGEYLVPVNFNLVGWALPGGGGEGYSDAAAGGIGVGAGSGAGSGTAGTIPEIIAHPTAYAQCQRWLSSHLPLHIHRPSSSNAAAVQEIQHPGQLALTAPNIKVSAPLQILAERICDIARAQTRFVLVGRSGAMPNPTGHDKTSIIVYPQENRPGSLLQLLTQFSTRDVDLTMIESRPVGNGMGQYRFMIDMKGHLLEHRISETLCGVYRVSSRVDFLGSYPAAVPAEVSNETAAAYAGTQTTNSAADPASPLPTNTEDVFIRAGEWLAGLKRSGQADRAG